MRLPASGQDGDGDGWIGSWGHSGADAVVPAPAVRPGLLMSGLRDSAMRYLYSTPASGAGGPVWDRGENISGPFRSSEGAFCLV
jgi:hypothetical protein